MIGSARLLIGSASRDTRPKNARVPYYPKPQMVFVRKRHLRGWLRLLTNPPHSRWPMHFDRYEYWLCPDVIEELDDERPEALPLILLLVLAVIVALAFFGNRNRTRPRLALQTPSSSTAALTGDCISSPCDPSR